MSKNIETIVAKLAEEFQDKLEILNLTIKQGAFIIKEKNIRESTIRDYFKLTEISNKYIGAFLAYKCIKNDIDPKLEDTYQNAIIFSERLGESLMDITIGYSDVVANIISSLKKTNLKK